MCLGVGLCAHVCANVRASSLCCGKQGKWGHPSEEVLTQLLALALAALISPGGVQAPLSGVVTTGFRIPTG